MRRLDGPDGIQLPGVDHGGSGDLLRPAGILRQHGTQVQALVVVRCQSAFAIGRFCLLLTRMREPGAFEEVVLGLAGSLTSGSLALLGRLLGRNIDDLLSRLSGLGNDLYGKRRRMHCNSLKSARLQLANLRVIRINVEESDVHLVIVVIVPLGIFVGMVGVL